MFEADLLLPWHPGFWEIYHSKLPLDWLTRIDDNGTQFLAPSMETGALDYVSCPEEFYDREEETMTWIEVSQVDPNADQFEGWYPFMEFDQPQPEVELFL